MKSRDETKKRAIISGDLVDWQAYRTLRNKITKLNRQKKRNNFRINFSSIVMTVKIYGKQ